MNQNTLLGILIPFAGTTLGSAMVFFMKKEMNLRIQKLLLGFAAGVMMAASVWSLLIPSIDMAAGKGAAAWIPAASGFLLGMGFLLLLDTLTPHLHFTEEKPEGMPAHLKKNHHACPCRYPAQYSGRHGGRGDFRRRSVRKHYDDACRRFRAFHRDRGSEFS